MTADAAGPPQPAHARLAGLGYLLIIVTGIFAEFFVRGGLVVPGDATATATNILGAGSLYRAGLAAEFVMLLADVLVAALLYLIFRPVSRTLATVAAAFRLAHAAVLGLNLLNTWFPLLVLGDAPYLAVLGPDQRHALALLFLEAHSFGYVIGLVFFGVHCLALGLLVRRSGYLPPLLGVLLLVAGAGYLVDSFGRTLMPGYAEHEALMTAIVFMPAFVGELSFCLWLLVRGVDPARPFLRRVEVVP